jgi:tetratricopeptide (TPR) repeat protein
MPELDEKTEAKIRVLCAKGYDEVDQGNVKEGRRYFYQAWTQLPKPQTDYFESGLVLAAIGDSYFATNDYSQGIESLTSALHCPRMHENAFIHMRLGQCYWETDNMEKARQHLATAYNIGGRKPFEQEAPKYLVTAMESN